MPSAESRTPMLIDTDTGIDDAVAIALAARLDELRVVGITTVHGNADVAHATRNAREVARRAGLDVPVVAGAAGSLRRGARPARETHGEEGLGYYAPSEPARAEPDRAGDFIRELALGEERGDDDLVICCLGPLTNLARLLRDRPSDCADIADVFIMGGALAVRGTQTRWSEFNWWADPEAAELVLRVARERALRLHLVPLDVTRRVAVPGSAIRALREAGRTDADARLWGESLAFYADFHRSWERFDGAVINDALAVALVARPELADWRTMTLGVSTSDDERRGAVIPDAPDGCPVRVAVGVRALDVVRLICERVFGRWLPPHACDDGPAAAERWLAENPL